MDFLDFRILSILNQNCRVNYSDMARLLQISSVEVSARIQTLVEGEIIHRFITIVDDRYLHRERRFIQFTTELPRALVLRTLTSVDIVRSVHPMLPHTYFCWLTVNDGSEMEGLLASLTLKLELDEIQWWTPLRPTPPMIDLDGLDYRILAVLRTDARQSIRALADSVEANYRTVHRRFHRLVEAEVCRFRLEFYPSHIERTIAFVLFATVEQTRYLARTLNQCFRLFPNRWSFATLADPPTVYYGTYAGKIADIDEMLETLRAREYATHVTCYLYLEHTLCDSIYDRLLEDAIAEMECDQE